MTDLRPDETCVTGVQTLEPYALRVPGSRRPPCNYFYVKEGRYQCALFDRLRQEAPRNLMNEGVFTRLELYQGFLYCVRLVVKNPEASCNRCGQCCKMWAVRNFALHRDKPCKGKGTLDNPENPCSKLIDNGDRTYSCSKYGEIFLCPVRLPTGAEYDLFEQFLDGTPIGQIRKLMMCPGCVYEFMRQP